MRVAVVASAQIFGGFQNLPPPQSLDFSAFFGLSHLFPPRLSISVIFDTDLVTLQEKAGSGNLSVEGAGNVEIGEAAHYGAETPEEMLDFTLSLAQLLDCEASDRYTLELGGLEWLCQDYVVQDYTFSYASAMIDEACYVVGCMYDDSTETAVLALYQQALASVRPWEG